MGCCGGERDPRLDGARRSKPRRGNRAALGGSRPVSRPQRGPGARAPVARQRCGRRLLTREAHRGGHGRGGRRALPPELDREAGGNRSRWGPARLRIDVLRQPRRGCGRHVGPSRSGGGEARRKGLTAPIGRISRAFLHSRVGRPAGIVGWLYVFVRARLRFGRVTHLLIPCIVCCVARRVFRSASFLAASDRSHPPREPSARGPHRNRNGVRARGRSPRQRTARHGGMVARCARSRFG